MAAQVAPASTDLTTGVAGPSAAPTGPFPALLDAGEGLGAQDGLEGRVAGAVHLRLPSLAVLAGEILVRAQRGPVLQITQHRRQDLGLLILGHFQPAQQGLRDPLALAHPALVTPLRLALAAVRDVRPAEVRTATSFARTRGYKPDYFALETDATVIFPWDRKIFDGDELIVNPRYEGVIDD